MRYSGNTPGVAFAYDRLGRQTTITDATGTRTFTYNDALQLSGETNTQCVLQYGFDNLGRPSGFAVGPNYSVNYTYDSVGRFSSVSSTVASVASYSYLPGSDLVQGYTTVSGFALMRSYEPNRNLIASITNGFGGVQLHRFDYTNDEIGRRTQRADFDLSTSISNFFAYNIRSELEDAAMGTNTFNYRYDPIGGILSADFNGTDAFYAYDANGNVTDLVGTNGAFLAQYQFDPYGNTISKTGALADVNPFRFSTKFLDAETGLYYYGHRYFNSELARWVSRDPIHERGGRNLYASFANSPLNKFDRLGKSATKASSCCSVTWVVSPRRFQTFSYNSSTRDFLVRLEQVSVTVTVDPPTVSLAGVKIKQEATITWVDDRGPGSRSWPDLEVGAPGPLWDTSSGPYGPEYSGNVDLTWEYALTLKDYLDPPVCLGDSGVTWGFSIVGTRDGGGGIVGTTF